LDKTNKEIKSKNAGANIKIIASDFDGHLCTYLYVSHYIRVSAWIAVGFSLRIFRK